MSFDYLCNKGLYENFCKYTEFLNLNNRNSEFIQNIFRMTKKEISNRTIDAINYLLDNQRGLTKAALADALFVKPTKFSEILNGRMLAGTEVMGGLAEKFNISAEWLLTGIGSMIKNELERNETIQDFSLRTDKHIEFQYIPLFEFDAAAGLVAIFNQHQIEPSDYIRIPNIPPVDGAIYVKGESMSPLIKNGDVVMFKKKEVNIDNILWGEIYILSFMNDGDSYTAVKYLRQSDRPDYIRLESFNPDFPPKDIPMSSITALAIVKASLTFHTME